MKITIVLTILLLTSPLAQASCKDDAKTFKKAREFGAYDFICKDEYDGRTTSSWKMSDEDYKLYRAWLRQSKIRKSK